MAQFGRRRPDRHVSADGKRGTVRFDDAGITDPPLVFDGGVAAIDMFTLNRAGSGVSQLGFDIQLPQASDVALPEVFDELCVVKVLPGPMVEATIDTKKMRWNVDSIKRGTFTDYTGRERYGVRFSHSEVLVFSGVGVASVPTKLADGRGLLMWFAEIPETTLDSLGYYGLYAKAAELTEKAAQRAYCQLLPADQITVPAQQIKWVRKLDEILRVNRPQIEDIVQRVYMALDETGVRVKAVTTIRAMGAPMGWEPPMNYQFGEKHPVVMWLTQPGSTLPFAVVATKADAWLDPGADVSFTAAAFTH